jgi:hypothetical protein
MVASALADPEVVAAAMDTAPEVTELAAAAATLRPLASTAELASATMTRVRMVFMTAQPSCAPPRMSGLSRSSTWMPTLQF